MLSFSDYTTRPNKHGLFFWYLVKIDFSSVCYCTRVHWTSNFLQGIRKKRRYITGDPVSVQRAVQHDEAATGRTHQGEYDLPWVRQTYPRYLE